VNSLSELGLPRSWAVNVTAVSRAERMSASSCMALAFSAGGIVSSWGSADFGLLCPVVLIRHVVGLLTVPTIFLSHLLSVFCVSLLHQVRLVTSKQPSVSRPACPPVYRLLCLSAAWCEWSFSMFVTKPGLFPASGSISLVAGHRGFRYRRMFSMMTSLFPFVPFAAISRSLLDETPFGVYVM